MPDRHADPAPQTSYRVQWSAKLADGGVHTHHHDHDDLEPAEADLASVETIPHIVSASLTEIVVTRRVRRVFARDGGEAGAQGVFSEPDRS